MSKIGDLLIGMQEDAECVSASCNSFEKFVEEMRKLNILYTPSLLEDFWDGYVHSQEPLANREQANTWLV